MSLTVQLIQSASVKFDHVKYPSDIYYHLIEQVRKADTPVTLGVALEHAIAWKLGKINKDADGTFTVNHSNATYRLDSINSYALSEEHRNILKSTEFFSWASCIREQQNFELNTVYNLEKRFKLWSSVVIPIFVTHCLRPKIYPIIDRFTLLAYSTLQITDTKAELSLKLYEKYHAWWLSILAEAGIEPMSAQLNQLKEINDGLSAFGKHIKQTVDKFERFKDDYYNESDHKPNAIILGFAPGKNEHDFRDRVNTLVYEGKTENEAFLQSACEMQINIKAKYIENPSAYLEDYRKNLLNKK